MADYRAKPGQEDRHGEMTGAIQFNMMLCMPVVAVWAIFVSPRWMGLTWNLVTSLGLAIVLPLLCLPLSRRLWAVVSTWMDTK